METNAYGNDHNAALKSKEQRLSYFDDYLNKYPDGPKNLGELSDEDTLSINANTDNEGDNVSGTPAVFARIVDEAEAGELLQQNLTEEKEADAALVNVAFHFINFDAK